MKKVRDFILLSVVILLTFFGLWTVISQKLDPLGKFIPKPPAVIPVGTTHALRDEYVTFEASYDFMLSTGNDTYIAIKDPEKVKQLESFMFENGYWTRPDGIEIIDEKVSLEPKSIAWSTGDGTSYADGLVLKTKATLHVLDNTKEKGDIFIELPAIGDIESQTNSTIIFPSNQGIRQGTRIQVQTVVVHETEQRKFFASTGRMILLFVLSAILIVSFFSWYSDTK
jgi:hypothetical protein